MPGWTVVSIKDTFTTVFEAADHADHEDARASAHR